MAKCKLNVMEKNNPIPVARLTLHDDYGYVIWEKIPMDSPGSFQSGKVTTVGNNSKMFHTSGKFAGQLYGKLINFTLHNYNKNLTYTMASGKLFFTCVILSDDF